VLICEGGERASERAHENAANFIGSEASVAQINQSGGGRLIIAASLRPVQRGERTLKSRSGNLTRLKVGPGGGGDNTWAARKFWSDIFVIFHDGGRDTAGG
jgi:hypothetical protein